MKSKKRNCYCETTTHEERKRSGIEKDFCGICEICGSQGHMQHSPHGPYTGAWCDKCLRVLLIMGIMQKIGVIIFIAGLHFSNIWVVAVGLVSFFQVYILGNWGKK